MATVAQKLRQIQAIKLTDLQEETRKLIQRSQPLIELKQDELRRGENSEGGRIGYYRNPNYRLFKSNLNPLASGTVDLRLSGSFYRGLYVDSKGNGLFQFDSNDDKSDYLFNKYRDIRGLQDNVFNSFLYREIAPQLRKYTLQRLRKV